MDDLDHLLARGQTVKYILPDRSFRNSSDKLLDHLVANIRFQQCQAHLAHGLIDIFRSKFAIATQIPENLLQSVG